MDDLIDSDTNAPEFSVSELSGAVKKTLEGAFGRVRVRGEIGRVVTARSGHVYFDLKDDRSVIASVAWKGVAARFQTRPEEGMEMVASGKLSTFGQQSKYQLIVDELAPAGVGALMVMLEKRKKALEAEGLFSPDRKQDLPYLPEVIGVVTSPQGAVIRDILHRLRDRFPREVLVWPVVVQGERCAPEVTAAIQGFNAIQPGGPVPRPDLLIVARGGGSIEDLWGFNEEAVVRAAAASEIPLISAVGHETDVTLIDYASDHRAPTPTAAAEVAVPVRTDLLAGLAALEERRVRGITRNLSQRRDRLRDLARLLPRPEMLVAESTQAYDALALRLPRALAAAAQGARLKLERQTGRFGPALLTNRVTRFRDALAVQTRTLPQALSRRTSTASERLTNLSSRLTPQAVLRSTRSGRQGVGSASARLNQAGASLIRQARGRFTAIERVHASLDYRATLKRGFSIVRGPTGEIESSVAAAKAAGALEIEFRDGRLAASVGKGTAPQPTKPAKPAKPRAKPKSDDDQGSLF